MRLLAMVILAGLVSACTAPVPDSGRGVGFEPYGNGTASDTPVVTGPIVNGDEISDEAVAAGSDVPQASNRLPLGTVGVDVGSEPPARPTPPEIKLDNPGISDEQDFSAVTSRETIESDRERIAAQRQAYQVIAPKALPTRPGKSFASIVEFALSTTNSVGQPLYSRSKILAKARFERNCAKYPSSDLAQEAFLKAGGPQRDRYGLDPDGDGFACFWDPQPYRLAENAATR